MIAEPEATRWTLVCLAHLEQEEALLSAVADSLRALQQALCRDGFAALAEAVDRQADLARAGEELRRRRNDLRERIAAVLDIAPASATLGKLADRLPASQAERLNQRRRALQAMAREVAELSSGNALLVRRCHEFTHRLLAAITGEACAPAGYGPSGRQSSIEPGTTAGRTGALIEVRG